MTNEANRGRSACDIGAFESQGYSLTLSGGNHQTALVNSTFAQPLEVTLSSNEPFLTTIGKQTINFTAPVTGAGLVRAAFTATTTGSGVATATVTANRLAGSYPVTATVGYLQVVFNLTNRVIAPDLQISKFVSPPTAAPGEALTYTIRFSNSGDEVATGVRVLDNLPPGLTGPDLDETVTIAAGAVRTFVLNVGVCGGRLGRDHHQHGRLQPRIRQRQGHCGLDHRSRYNTARHHQPETDYTHQWHYRNQ